MKTAVLVLLAACSEGPTPPKGAECANVAYGQPMIDCAVNALNTAMGCEQFEELGPGVVHNLFTDAKVKIDFTDTDPATDAAGEATPDAVGEWHVQVTTASPFPWMVAGTLIHELGHTMLITFPDNPSDPHHSPVSGNIMESGSVQSITAQSMAGFVADVNNPASTSWVFSCANPNAEHVKVMK